MSTLEFVLNKFKIPPGEKSPIYIEGTRDLLPPLFNDLGYKVGVEVGVLEGVYSEILCKMMPQAKIYSVDPWTFYPMKKNARKQKDYDRIYPIAVKRLEIYSNNQIMKMGSVEAARTFTDGSLDFVFIDGNHEFQAITNDICEWLPKVKVGGIISGHDYGNSHDRQFGNVKDVVNAYTMSKRITPLFVLETAKYMNNRDSEDYRETSFFWVKQ